MKKLSVKFEEMTKGIDHLAVNRAILHGARIGTEISSFVLSVSVLYCLVMALVSINHGSSDIVLAWRMLMFIVQVVLSVKYVNAYYKNDSTLGIIGATIIEDRSFSPADGWKAKILDEVVKMSIVSFVLLGLAMSAFFAFFASLTAAFLAWRVVILILLIGAMLITFIRVRFFLARINDLYAEERRARDAFSEPRFDEDGDPIG